MRRNISVEWFVDKVKILKCTSRLKIWFEWLTGLNCLKMCQVIGLCNIGNHSLGICSSAEHISLSKIDLLLRCYKFSSSESRASVRPAGKMYTII
jgi:hypothetical protein